MAFSYEILPSGDHIQIVGTGKFTTADCLGIIERVMTDPRCRPDSTALINLSEASYEPGDQAEVFRIASSLETFHSMMQNNIAIVANHAMLFVAEILSSHIRKTLNVKIRVFVDLDAAQAFCNVPVV